MRKLILMIATAGGIGLVPIAPGTFGSALGVALWAGLAAAGTAASVFGWIALSCVAIWASGRAEQSLGRDDGRIVIDEVAGQLTALLLLTSCATIQHPASPGVQYASMEQCQNQHLQDSPGDCAKMIHQQATTQAVGVGATILVVLGYFALIGLILAGR